MRPFTSAATAALASRGPIFSATSLTRAEGGTSRTLPSGSLTLSIGLLFSSPSGRGRVRTFAGLSVDTKDAAKPNPVREAMGANYRTQKDRAREPAGQVDRRDP